MPRSSRGHGVGSNGSRRSPAVILLARQARARKTRARREQILNDQCAVTSPEHWQPGIKTPGHTPSTSRQHEPPKV
jgi:hypothetical protein